MLAHHKIIRTFVAFIYPTYKSLKAMISDEKEDSKTMLRYWIVLAGLSSVELVADLLLDFYGYLFLKCVLLVWCMAPSKYNGANLIFTQVTYFCPGSFPDHCSFSLLRILLFTTQKS